jgi:hypothetical protein
MERCRELTHCLRQLRFFPPDCPACVGSCLHLWGLPFVRPFGCPARGCCCCGYGGGHVFKSLVVFFWLLGRSAPGNVTKHSHVRLRSNSCQLCDRHPTPQCTTTCYQHHVCTPAVSVQCRVLLGLPGDWPCMLLCTLLKGCS